MDHRSRRSTVRARPRVALGMALLGAAALAGGCTTGADGGRRDATPTPSATVPTPTGTTPQPSPTVRAAVTVPTSAFLELQAEIRKSPRTTTPVANALPKLCGQEFGTGGRAVTASAAMMSVYKRPGDPPENVPQGTITQTIFAFEGDGADAHLRRVRGSLDSCRSFRRWGGTVDVRTRPLPGVGDEALLVTLRWPQTDLQGNRVGGEAVSQIAVIRVADVTTVLHDQGWEGTSGDPALMDDLTRTAVAALDAWRR
ncbi:hypothetical protein GA0070606_4304 [Micromonospora citrea]|uniref:PknH-like extracellular domain-containing protein n=1 Tax=Micromonospora citrea TaxID=47855 RepID=A0A1C6VJ84_9ACTN|nr:hypothetical protein [Micromonospora citrea]SCL66342.1 hypothetical protein GA0070606_4304 [Micromonospora citrea]